MAAPGPAGGQAAEAPPDSAETEQRLREAQRAFAHERRSRFPFAAGGSEERCDERLGRFCLIHEEGAGRKPRVEDEEVRRRRGRLIERLGSAARRFPGSAWIAGQRVRYLVQAGRSGAAVEAARACRAEGWWCRALEGFALHEAGRPGRADTAFRAALEAMADARRRSWLDLSPVLEEEARDRLAGLSGRARQAWRARLWWLSDPLWSVAGRGRRVGHLARHVRSRLLREAGGPYGVAWGEDLEELIVRYGWPVAWSRLRPEGLGGGFEVPVVGHYASHARSMIPPAAVLAEPSGADSGSWPLEPTVPRTAYAPPYLDTLVRPPVELSRFPRPDTLHLVAAWRWPEGKGASARLRLEQGPGRLVGVASGRQAGSTGRLVVAGPLRPMVASLELVARGRRRAARHRTGLRPLDRPEGLPGVSDLLLTVPAERDPSRDGNVRAGGRDTGAGLSGAAARARPPGPARPGERIGLYWEVYGPAALLQGGTTELRLLRTGGGFFRGVAEALGLVGERRAVTVGWPTAPGPTGRVHPGTVTLTLPDDLEPGGYRLELVVRAPGREPLRSRRPLEVTASPEPGDSDGAGR